MEPDIYAMALKVYSMRSLLDKLVEAVSNNDYGTRSQQIDLIRKEIESRVHY